MSDRSMAVLVLAAACALAADEAWSDVRVELVSTAPTRPHFVAAGALTTFVLAVHNDSDVSEPVGLEVQGVSGAQGSWSATLAEADELFRPTQPGAGQVGLSVPPRDSRRMVLSLRAAENLPEGAEATVTVGARTQGILRSALEARAAVRHRPKLFYVAIDGCGRRYLDLNRRGTRYDGTGERLMPNAWNFTTRSAWMRGASAGLPAVTDPNHLAVLTGSWPGTLALYQVNGRYVGVGAGGHPLMERPTPDALRWGSDGQRVRSVFDASKDPASGGAPAAFNAVVTGKAWLADHVRDRLDVSVHGSEYPYYVPPPAEYRLGDPPSDGDAEQDYEGTNPGPRLLRHRTSLAARLVTTLPSRTPSDRWTAEAAVRLVQAEDPDVLYVDLADTDVAAHIFGGADRPEEWVDPGTPDRIWDDENIYNRNANRDPVLDVVHEADWDFGAILQALQARGVLDHGVVVLLSDHGLTTAMNAPETIIDVGAVLLAHGTQEADFERLAGRGQFAHIFLADPAKSDLVEAILEGYETVDPVEGRSVKPLMVINRREMDSGVDAASGPFGSDEIAGNHRGELYSEWSIDSPLAEGKVKWPDLFVFTRGHFRTELGTDVSQSGIGAPVNGVHGAPSTAEVMAMLAGPRIRPGTYDGPATLADVGATLFELVGAPAPGNVDGRVLTEILR